MFNEGLQIDRLFLGDMIALFNPGNVEEPPGSSARLLELAEWDLPAAEK